MSSVGVSIVTSPPVTYEVLMEGRNLGVKFFFLQPGTATTPDVKDAIAKLRAEGIVVIESCVLVELGCSM